MQSDTTDDTAFRLADSATDVLASSDGHCELSDREKSGLLAELSALRQRLETLPVIEQAKGVLMGQYGMDADAAFALLARCSQHSKTKLRDIAATLVDAAASSPAQSDGSHPSVRRTVERLQRPGRGGHRCNCSSRERSSS